MKTISCQIRHLILTMFYIGNSKDSIVINAERSMFRFLLLIKANEELCCTTNRNTGPEIKLSQK